MRGWGAALPVDSRGGGSGSGRAPQSLDGREHVGEVMSNSPLDFKTRIRYKAGNSGGKAAISSEF